MIRFEIINEQRCPIVYCDVCGDRIEDAVDALVVGDELNIVHKGECDRALGMRTPYIHLDQFLYELGHNVGYKEENGRKRHLFFNMVGV